MHRPTDRITHTRAFVTPVVEHWLEREIAQWVHPLYKELNYYENLLCSLKRIYCTFVICFAQGGIGLNVAQMIVELIRDKRKIVDRITHEQIDEFVALLHKTQVSKQQV